MAGAYPSGTSEVTNLVGERACDDLELVVDGCAVEDGRTLA
jgi:hypothetical protein